MSEEEKDIYNAMHEEYDDLTSGYSTISSNKGEFGTKKPSISMPAMNNINRLALFAKAIQNNNENS